MASNLTADLDDTRKRVMRKLHVRIVWYCLFLFIINYLDRVNVGFAALQMNSELAFDPKIFGFGAGIFSFGYIFFEVPSNMILHKLGARRWIARILVTWGIVSCLMATIQGPYSFYILRFLLGVAEAGFAPGVLLYLTYWFPRKERGKAVAGFMLATCLSLVIGAPLSGWIMDATNGWYGFSGWRWMFLLEGLPAVLMGFVTWFYLIDRPEEDKRWLNAQDRQWLIQTMERERAEMGAEQTGRHSLMEAMRDSRVWRLTAVYGFNGIAFYGVVLWLPQIVKGSGDFSNLQIGFISAIPFVFSALGLVLVARSSDKTGERKLHNAVCLLCGGLFLAASALVDSPILALILLCGCTFCLWAVLGVFWTMPSQFLNGAAAAAGFAAINGFAQFSGFIGPYMMGAIRSATDSFTTGLLALSVTPIIACLICMTLPLKRDT